MKGRISEIFSSIQGEGVYAGQKQIFVRFSGCNLNCAYCDTDFGRFQEYESKALYSKIESFGGVFHSISFTGGEPLLQKDFLKESLPLVKRGGYKTYLETNGTLPESLDEVVDNVDIIAMDIKLPSSGGLSDFWQAHRDFLRIAQRREVFIKAVICLSTADKDVMAMYDMLKVMKYSGILVLQPNSFELDSLKGRLTLLKSYGEGYPFHICVIPQMHKIMGVR
jgi:organic radical activating enzyme